MKNMAFEKNIDDILISDLQATQVAGDPATPGCQRRDL